MISEELFGKRIFFLGIGGISMSALARYAAKKGAFVSGSDINESETTLGLIAEGIPVAIGHSRKNLPPDTSFAVASSAVPENSPEIKAAKRLGIPVVSRAKFLGGICAAYPKTIAVAGTHGKTTVTAMLYYILRAAGLDCELFLGGHIPETYEAPLSGDILLTEACEYKDSFLELFPDVGVILNAEWEHADYFSSEAKLLSSFADFAQNCREGLILNREISSREYLARARSVKYFSSEDSLPKDCALKVFGEHNRLNALAAAAAAKMLGIGEEYIAAGLSAFPGVKRRLELLGDFNGAWIYDDYAHHPTEISAGIAALRQKHPGSRLWVIFQPHTYSRLNAFFEDFAQALCDADRVLLLPVYAAREKPSGKKNPEALAKILKKEGVNALFIGDFDEAKSLIVKKMKPGDVLAAMGAGDVDKLVKSLF
ncbi:MAG: UDP-N-acetylmuramate--L-alanine ligase [Firmicutes bacterium]|nr:UDP-N-acetylmuramate--L-alanine ligase [Bacillota bacterium]